MYVKVVMILLYVLLQILMWLPGVATVLRNGLGEAWVPGTSSDGGLAEVL